MASRDSGRLSEQVGGTHFQVGELASRHALNVMIGGSNPPLES